MRVGLGALLLGLTALLVVPPTAAAPQRESPGVAARVVGAGTPAS